MGTHLCLTIARKIWKNQQRYERSPRSVQSWIVHNTGWTAFRDLHNCTKLGDSTKQDHNSNYQLNITFNFHSPVLPYVFPLHRWISQYYQFNWFMCCVRCTHWRCCTSVIIFVREQITHETVPIPADTNRTSIRAFFTATSNDLEKKRMMGNLFCLSQLELRQKKKYSFIWILL